MLPIAESLESNEGGSVYSSPELYDRAFGFRDYDKEVSNQCASKLHCAAGAACYLGIPAAQVGFLRKIWQKHRRQKLSCFIELG